MLICVHLWFLIWCSSWIGKTVEWRGRIFEVRRDGKMVQVNGALATDEHR